MTSETWHLQLVEKGCGNAHYRSNLADTVLHMSLPISAGHRSFRASSPSTTFVSESADLERSVDATMHVQPSSPPPPFFPSIFFSRFLSPSHRQKFRREKRAGGRGEGKFDKFLRGRHALQMDRSIVLWYFEFGCSFCQWKRMLSRKLIETLRNLKSNANSIANVFPLPVSFASYRTYRRKKKIERENRIAVLEWMMRARRI